MTKPCSDDSYLTVAQDFELVTEDMELLSELSRVYVGRTVRFRVLTCTYRRPHEPGCDRKRGCGPGPQRWFRLPG